MSQRAVPKPGRSVAGSAEVLANNLSHPAHQRLALNFHFTDVVTCCTGGVVDHRQVTDAYLLTAAIRAGMKLFTLNTGVGMLLASDTERKAYPLPLGKALGAPQMQTSRGRAAGARVQKRRCGGGPARSRWRKVILPLLRS